MACKAQQFQIGDKVKIVNGSQGTSQGTTSVSTFAQGNIGTVHEVTGLLHGFLYLDGIQGNWVHFNNVEKVSCDKVSVSCLENKVTCLKKRLSCAESRLSMMKELGLDSIDLTEFKIYAAIRAMQAEDQSDIDKAKTIAHIVKSC